MNKKVVRTISKILTLLMMVLGTITIIQTCNKIVVTSVELIILRDNAIYYGSMEMQEGYDANNQLRQAIYNSQDDLIREFSNQDCLVKAGILIFAILMYPLIMITWMRRAMMFVYRVKKRSKNRKKLTNNIS